MRKYLLPRHEKDRPILVWCRSCQRYVSQETAHTCILPPDYRTRRDTARAVKQQEITNARH